MSSILRQFLLEQTVWIPIIFCLTRYKEIKPVYVPLLMYLFAKEGAEIISLVMIKVIGIKNNAPPYNVLYLLEALLITWLLYNLTAFKSNRNRFVILQVFWILLWLADTFFIRSFWTYNQLFRISYTFILVLLMLGLISRLAISVRLRLYRNTAFCICIAFTFWFLYNMLYEFTDYISKYEDIYIPMGNMLTEIISYVEMLLFVVISWAVYCIPVKRRSF